MSRSYNVNLSYDDIKLLCQCISDSLNYRQEFDKDKFELLLSLKRYQIKIESSSR